MRIASWNVNSVRARETVLEAWLGRHQPDVVCLQETKVVDEDFPTDPFLRLGYEAVVFGQKTYNGVALLSRHPVSEVHFGLSGADQDAERRFVAAQIHGLWVASAYVPNGQAVGTRAFSYKLDWLERLRFTVAELRREGSPVVVGGDFNVARDMRDLHDPAAYDGRLLFHPDERAALAALIDSGLADSLRMFQEGSGHFSWWDYRLGKRRHNRGLRLDYLFLSEELRERCTAAWIEEAVRWEERPSDHAPVLVDLAEAG